LSIDHEKRRISLGLKPSYFSEDDFHNLDDDTESEAEDANLGVQDLSHGTDNDEAPSDTGDDEGADDHDIEMENVAFPEVDRHTDGDEDDEDEQDMDHNLDALVPLNLNSAEPSSSALAAAPSLQLRTGFQWAVANTTFGDVDAESAPSEEEDKEVTGNRKKKSRKEIQQDLTADMHTKTPQSISDFERLLLGSPNSSYLWIQYMSFQLQLSEVDKAREVARRALRSINFREEQEKLNVWVALLNLENIYGTEETLESTFKDAARGNDSKTVHLRLAAILDQSDKVDVSSA
jgi:rRNA biogenesis protein RRP5